MALRLLLAVLAWITFAATSGATPATQRWTGAYGGGSIGYGRGTFGLSVPNIAASATTLSCVDRLNNVYQLIAPPAGTVFGFPQEYPASVASVLGLVPIPGSSLFRPTNNVAFDWRSQNSDCLAYTAFAQTPSGNYVGGRQGVPTFPNPQFPADFVPSDINGTVVATTNTSGPSAADLGPFAAAVVDAPTQAALLALQGTTVEFSTSGFIGGAQAGYNWFLTPTILIGVEADIMGSTVSGEKHIGTASIEAEISWYTTLRGRIATVSGPWMAYGTIGIVMGDTSVTYNVGGVSATDHQFATGLAVGGGLEYAISDTMSVRAQYLYLNFGTEDYPAGTTFDLEGRFEIHAFTIGTNFKF